MQKTIEKRTMRSMVAGSLSFGLVLVRSIFLVPVFLECWGHEKYGIWISIFALVLTLRTFDLGHANYVGNEFNRLYQTDRAQAKRVLGSGFWCAMLLGLIELLVFIALVTTGWDTRLFDVGPSGERFAVNLGIIALLVRWWLGGNICGILVRIILPLGIYDRTVRLSMGFQVAEILLLLVAGNLDFSILTLCLAYCGAEAVYSVVLFGYVRRSMPEFYPWWRNGSWSLAKKNLWRSTSLTLQNFLEQFNMGGVVLLVSSMGNVAMVPLLTTTRTLGNLFLQVSYIWVNPLYPELAKFHAKKESSKILDTVKGCWFLSGLFTNISFLSILPFIEIFYRFWTRNQLEFDRVFYLLVTLSISFGVFGRAVVSYNNCANHINLIVKAATARSLLIFCFSASLFGQLNLTAVGIGLLAGELIGSVFIPIYFFRDELLINGCHLANRTLVIYLMPSLILLTTYLLIECSGRTWIPVIFGVFALCGIQILGWRELSKDVRGRLTKAIRLRLV